MARSCTYLASVAIPPRTLAPGRYSFLAGLPVPSSPITIVEGGSEFAQYEGLDYGCVLVDCKWDASEVGLYGARG